MRRIRQDGTATRHERNPLWEDEEEGEVGEVKERADEEYVANEEGVGHVCCNLEL